MKIKRGTEYLHENKPVWVEMDLENGLVLVCDSIRRGVEDFYHKVGINTLLTKKSALKTLKTRQNKKPVLIELDKWYESQEVPERCENCNLPLNAFNKWAKRCVTAHIVPKSQFPEVATHPMNRFFAGTHLFSDCSCHSEYDNLDAEHRKSMRIYPEIMKRAKEFVTLIPENKLPKFEKYLGL